MKKQWKGKNKMDKESNYYYESTIKTIRNDDNGIISKVTMPLITNEEMMAIDNNLQNIVDEFIKKIVKDKDLALSQYIIKKQNGEKQLLINYLKDEQLKNKDIIKMVIGDKDKEYYEGKIDTYQEVLDFVNKGGKDE